MPRVPSAAVLRLAAITAVYFAAGRLGLSFAFVNESASAIWPPTGIAIASLLLYGLPCWPAVFAGAFLVNLATSGSVVPSTAIACGNTLEAVVGAWLIHRYARGTRALERADDICRAAVMTTAAAAPVAATIGTATLYASGLALRDDLGAVWTTWWLGDAAGAVTVAPLILLWARRPWFTAVRARPVEALTLAIVLVATTMAIFGDFTRAGREHWSLAWVCLPVLLWAALRFGPRECAAGAAVMMTIAIRGTLDGYGPFASHPPNVALLMLQTFVSVLVLATLATAAEAAQRREREAELRLLNQELERRVSARTADLARAQDRLAEAQRIAHVGSWEWDIANDSVWWSDEMYRIYGREPSTFAASYDGFLRCVHPDDVPDVRRHVARAVETGEPMVFEHRIIRLGGGTGVLAAHADVVNGPDGRPARLRGTAQDITEQRRAEEQRAALAREHAARLEAEEANRAKDQFMAMLSHELRTPLNAVLGWSHMLMHDALDDVVRERALDMIHRNATIQAQLVADMMDISRMNAGQIVLDVTLVDLPSLVDSAIETIRPSAVENGVDLEASIDRAASVQGDTKRLAQVMNNLLNNAIKFTPHGGRVSVTLAKVNGMATIEVRDTGPGIPPAFLPHVFDRFRQADDSVTRAHGGLGLGLAIVRHIVERHGGNVSVANRTDGTGAVFTVRLPALAAKDPAAVQTETHL